MHSPRLPGLVLPPNRQNPPCTIADAKVYLDEKQDSEDGVVEGIATE